MLALSDSQLEELKTLAAPLHPRWRSIFLRDLAAEIGDRADVGDGELRRIALKVRQSTIERAREPRHRGVPPAAAAIGGRPKKGPRCPKNGRWCVLPSWSLFLLGEIMGSW
jgi:hypothetical protein